MNFTIDIKKAWQIQRTEEGILFVNIVENINYIRDKTRDQPNKEATWNILKEKEVNIDLLGGNKLTIAIW